ncbi:DNA polymerase IV [Escherichia coli]|uniref:DNA-directed DNA polymerase n=1 Tax=Escherichia coli TaxID=562 RepID=A0A485JMW1_ECOLX|nr:DNA polymerase IV [Escherichia coli]
MRKIIHVDMDCFFAAVEMRDNPALRDIPIAIGGSRERRGVISTANYPARKFGVRSAMPTGMALKLCPHLTLLPGRFDAYKEASNHIREIFSRYTSRIEPLSLDEAYLDVTDSVPLPRFCDPHRPENPPDDFQRAATDGVCGRGTSKVSRQNRLRHE